MNLDQQRYTGFICILALATVSGREIKTYYPDFGPETYVSLFSRIVSPRQNVETFPTIHILFFNESSDISRTGFKHNHYVPLAFSKPKKIKQICGDIFKHVFYKVRCNFFNARRV